MKKIYFTSFTMSEGKGPTRYFYIDKSKTFLDDREKFNKLLKETFSSVVLIEHFFGWFDVFYFTDEADKAYFKMWSKSIEI